MQKQLLDLQRNEGGGGGGGRRGRGVGVQDLENCAYH